MEPKAAATPDKVADYRVIRRIATGGTSDVLLARAEGPHGFERVVVLKILLPHHRQDPTFERLFAREAAAYGRLSHPAIVRLFDFLSDDGQLVLVLEFVDGLPLNKLRTALKARGEEIDDRAALYVASRIFSALGAAHAVKDADTGAHSPVIHRDVNPSNVLIPWDGHAKLADFGIAKVTGVPGDTKAGLIKGTYGYMAPEQAKGQTISERTDVYAASLVLWELLTRRRAIQRANVPEAEILQAMAKPHLPSLDVLRPTLPKPLRDALRAGLEASPERRTITADEFYGVLRTAANLDDGRGVLANAMAKVRPAPVADLLAITVSSRAAEPSWASRPLDDADDTLMGSMQTDGLPAHRPPHVSSLAPLLEPDEQPGGNAGAGGSAPRRAPSRHDGGPPMTSPSPLVTMPSKREEERARGDALAVPPAPETVPAAPPSGAGAALSGAKPPVPAPPKQLLSKHTLDGGFSAPGIAAAAAAHAAAARVLPAAPASPVPPPSSVSPPTQPFSFESPAVAAPTSAPMLVEAPPALFAPAVPEVAAAMAQEPPPAPRAAYRPWLSSNTQSQPMPTPQPPPSSSSSGGNPNLRATQMGVAPPQSSYSSLLGGGPTQAAPQMVRPREPQLTPSGDEPNPPAHIPTPARSDHAALRPAEALGFGPPPPLYSQSAAAMAPGLPTPPSPQQAPMFAEAPMFPSAAAAPPQITNGYGGGYGASDHGAHAISETDGRAKNRAGLFVGLGIGALVLLVAGAFGVKAALSGSSAKATAASAASAPATLAQPAAPPARPGSDTVAVHAAPPAPPPPQPARVAPKPPPAPKPQAPAPAAAPPPVPVVAKPPPAPAKPPPAPAKVAAAKATTGVVIPPPSAKGHRVFADGKVVGHDASPITLPCGKRTIKVGSGGKPQTVDVPCGGEITMK